MGTGRTAYFILSLLVSLIPTSGVAETGVFTSRASSRWEWEQSDSLPAPKAARLPPTPERWKPFRFHPGPKSKCGTFAITELATLYRLGKDERVVRGSERYYGSFDAGLEHNVSDALALGGSGFLGLDNDRTQAGIRLRARWWLSERTSLDLAPGLILGGKEEKSSEFLGPVLILRGGLYLSNSFGVTAQTFETRRRKEYGVETERATYVGALLNSRAGFVGVNVAVMIAAVGYILILSSL